MERQQHVLVFNGEIYNFVELRVQLEGEGYHFDTGTDTEVLLAAYAHWGDACVSRLRGMWAFALFDRPRRRVLLSRDRFGIKPLYYTRQGHTLLFASEIKAFAAAGVPMAPNLDTWADFLVASYVDHDPARTFYAGVQALPPAHLLVVDLSSGGETLRPYYQLDEALAGRESDQDAFAHTLQQSVSLHLRSDVPVGICLSGGLDSSTLAALAAPQYQQARGTPMTAFTARSHDAFDEGVYAQKVASALGMDWVQAVPTTDSFLPLATRVMQVQQQPTGSASVLMQYKVMETAAAHGIKVLLDGQGADEVLLGYERYYTHALRTWLRQGRWGRAAREARLAVRHSRMTARELVGYSIYFQVPTLRRRHLARRSASLRAEVVRPVLQRLRDEPREGSLQAYQVRQVQATQLPHLLRYEDLSSMAFSLEARVPYVDHEVVEAGLALPLGLKIRDGYTKYALRQVCAQLLPAEIAWRRNKIGFEAPIAQWQPQVRAFVAEAWPKSALRAHFCAAPVLPQHLDQGLLYRFFELLLWEQTCLPTSPAAHA